MFSNQRPLVVAALILTLFTTSLFLGASMVSAKGGGGSVSQEKVSTGYSGLNKGINNFYSCVSKTHKDPPTIEKVDSCYYKGVGGSSSIGTNGTSSSGSSADSLTGTLTGTDATSTAPSSTSTGSHHHKHG